MGGNKTDDDFMSVDDIQGETLKKGSSKSDKGHKIKPKEDDPSDEIKTMISLSDEGHRKELKDITGKEFVNWALSVCPSLNKHKLTYEEFEDYNKKYSLLEKIEEYWAGMLIAELKTKGHDEFPVH